MGATQVIITTVGSVLGAYLLYLGVRFTATKSKEGVDRTADVAEQDSALKAWQELLEPYRTETADLRRRIEEMEDRDAKKRREVDRQITRLTERIDLQAKQIEEWKRVAKVIARWATAMRDEILRLNGTLPATPDELLTLQAIEDAEQS